MTYDRLDLTTGDLLDQDVFKHLEDGIEGAYNKSHRMFDELYDVKRMKILNWYIKLVKIF